MGRGLEKIIFLKPPLSFPHKREIFREKKKGSASGGKIGVDCASRRFLPSLPLPTPAGKFFG